MLDNTVEPAALKAGDVVEFIFRRRSRKSGASRHRCVLTEEPQPYATDMPTLMVEAANIEPPLLSLPGKEPIGGVFRTGRGTIPPFLEFLGVVVTADDSDFFEEV